MIGGLIPLGSSLTVPASGHQYLLSPVRLSISIYHYNIL